MARDAARQYPRGPPALQSVYVREKHRHVTTSHDQRACQRRRGRPTTNCRCRDECDGYARGSVANRVVTMPPGDARFFHHATAAAAFRRRRSSTATSGTEMRSWIILIYRTTYSTTRSAVFFFPPTRHRVYIIYNICARHGVISPGNRFIYMYIFFFINRTAVCTKIASGLEKIFKKYSTSYLKLRWLSDGPCVAIALTRAKCGKRSAPLLLRLLHLLHLLRLLGFQ